MSSKDKAKNTAEQAKGQLKKKTGKATDNRDLQAKGKAQEVAGNVKQAGENVKDAVKK